MPPATGLDVASAVARAGAQTYAGTGTIKYSW
jgi:hypothetical protein